MKETFINKNFGDAALSMIETINNILDDYATQGYDLSLRQLYYQLVSKNVVPNTERSYKNIGVIVSDARLAGMIDWDMIKDRGRETIGNPHWNDPSDFLESVAPQYRINLWSNQENYVEVMVEKQALEGVLLPVCRKLDINFTANKGYSSSSAMYEASKRYLRNAKEGKSLYVIYLGDHDPSGIDMSRDILDRLDLFTKEDVQVNRIALNMDQVEEMNPPENPAKITDSRARAYIKRFGDSSWELDAIEPMKLASLVTKAVVRLTDKKIWDATVETQAMQRESIERVADDFRERMGS